MLPQSYADSSPIGAKLKRLMPVRRIILSPTVGPDQVVLCQRIPCTRLLQEHLRLRLMATCRQRDGRSQNQRSAKPREGPQLLAEQLHTQY